MKCGDCKDFKCPSRSSDATQECRVQWSTFLPTPETDWAAFRRDAAKAAMLKMLMRDFDTDVYPDPQEICGMAVLYADELIKQLNTKRNETEQSA